MSGRSPHRSPRAREPALAQHRARFAASDGLAALAARQADSDERLIAWCEAADVAAFDAQVEMDRGSRVDQDPAARVLVHLFMHQTHHRGQLHAMLSSTAVATPPLDEFLLASDARFRAADLAALGWIESQLLGA